ncbi:MAG TPA: hypothetical protein VGF55_09535 [Gemmataceae bacterium]
MSADRTIDPRFLDHTAIEDAMQRGVRRAVWEHKQLGYPICIWRDGRVTWVPPEEIDVEKPQDERGPGHE